MNRRHPESYQERIQREQYRAESEAIGPRNVYNPNHPSNASSQDHARWTSEHGSQPYFNDRPDFQGRPMTGSSNDYGVGREWDRSDYSRPYGASQANEYPGAYAQGQRQSGGQYGNPQGSAWSPQGQYPQPSQYGSSGYGGNYGAGQYGQPQYGQPLAHGGSGYSQFGQQHPYGAQPQGFRGGYPESSFGYAGQQGPDQYSSGRYDPQMSGNASYGSFGNTTPYGQRSGDFAGRGPKNYSRSNERVREDICERLTADPYIDAHDLDVRCENGTVVIEGQVEERWMKHRIEDLVDSTAGVKQIDNRVTVSGQRQGSSYGQRGSDAQSGSVPSGTTASSGSSAGSSPTTGSSGTSGASGSDRSVTSRH